jgi:rhodanese-related sulfurtransferase
MMGNGAQDEIEDGPVSAKRARELVAGGRVAVLDIRSEEEWSTVGNIPGAVHVPEANDLESRLPDLPERDALLVVCRDGEHSAEVAERLGEGDRRAISIEGGMDAWRDDNLPLQPSEDPTLPSEPGSVEDEISSG